MFDIITGTGNASIVGANDTGKGLLVNVHDLTKRGKTTDKTEQVAFLRQKIRVNGKELIVQVQVYEPLAKGK